MTGMCTEGLCRVMRSARSEAARSSSFIEAEHLLLALAHEDAQLLTRFLGSGAWEDRFRLEIEKQGRIPPGAGPTEDLGFSNGCKRVMAYAGEEASRLANDWVGTEHLLLGLIREEASLAAKMLRQSGAELKKIRWDLSGLAKLGLEAPDDGLPKRARRWAGNLLMEWRKNHRQK